VIQRELLVGDDIQSHIGGPSGIVDSGQFITLYFVYSVVGDSNVGTSSERHEVAPQHDSDHESHHLTGKLRVSEDMLKASTRHFDDTHALVAD
jgi:hypothetical protein